MINQSSNFGRGNPLGSSQMDMNLAGTQMSNMPLSSTSPMSNIRMETEQKSNVPMSSQQSMTKSEKKTPQTVVSQATEDAMTYRALYPEIYYKLQPYISAACDIMDSYGITMPTQKQLDDMTDGIYEEFVRTYPDMAEYMSEQSTRNNPNDPPPFSGGFRRFRPGFRFRRRGLGRDFISALLLAELLGRGRFFF
ncbi:hypothetical protein CCDG5_0592 [[Clostridium] cellulosi]|uniref:Uncharacterized protein n=1 Tax=[Clostridium] cellulosi TaxID=29343 RepID=A0A078KMP0_9FIRM|nr:MAG: hypothetical protein DIU81_04655 [[Clostridium] cellulosi]CDZ23723.1 hypothetical protein CCDG5_0592 [[Clostridium] cellulosi]